MQTLRSNAAVVLALLVAVLADLLFFKSPAAVSSLAVTWPIIAKTRAQLREQANPTVVAGGQSECLAHVFFDTLLYTDNVTTQLVFFQQVNIPGITNMEQQGALPDPQYFEVVYFGLDILRAPTATPLAAWGDAWLILFGPGAATIATGQRAIFTFIMSAKNYGPWPLSFCHGSGGLHGSSGYGTTTPDTTGREFQTNSVPDGGWFEGGTITIPYSTGFQVVAQWPSAVNISANVLLSMNMVGTLHRRVL